MITQLSFFKNPDDTVRVRAAFFSAVPGVKTIEDEAAEVSICLNSVHQPVFAYVENAHLILPLFIFEAIKEKK